MNLSCRVYPDKLTKQQELNVIHCAWKKHRNATILHQIVYVDHLEQQTTSKNIGVREIIYDPEFIQSGK